MLCQPVGLEESKRKSDWARADLENFEGQWLFCWPKNGEI